jgi:hypothetical protein
MRSLRKRQSLVAEGASRAVIGEVKRFGEESTRMEEYI